jgi:hypothetical protein
MISTHCPAILKHIVAIAGIVNLFAICQDDSLSRRNTPNNGHVVFFATASCPGFTTRQGFGVCKTKPPRKFNEKLRSSEFTGNVRKKCQTNHVRISFGTEAQNKIGKEI